jgi:hypothetical protein
MGMGDSVITLCLSMLLMVSPARLQQAPHMVHGNVGSSMYSIVMGCSATGSAADCYSAGWWFDSTRPSHGGFFV